MSYVKEVAPATISNLIDHGSDDYLCGPYTDIPAEYQSKFLNLLNELEQTTGKSYTCELQGLSCNLPMRIKPFDKREKYIVCDMAEGYEELEGEYKNIQEIKAKIRQLQYEGLYLPSGGWKCPECGCEDNYTGNESCQGSCSLQNCCDYFHRSKWKMVDAYPSSQKIYRSSGGSFACLTPLGNLKVM